MHARAPRSRRALRSSIGASTARPTNDRILSRVYFTYAMYAVLLYTSLRTYTRTTTTHILVVRSVLARKLESRAYIMLHVQLLCGCCYSHVIDHKYKFNSCVHKPRLYMHTTCYFCMMSAYTHQLKNIHTIFFIVHIISRILEYRYK